MTRRSIDASPPGEGPARRERRPRKNGARFTFDGRLDGGERGLWHVRVYTSAGSWWISARRHRRHRVWVISAEDGFAQAVREAIRRELAQRTTA